jgi:hypothetical protein
MKKIIFILFSILSATGFSTEKQTENKSADKTHLGINFYLPSLQFRFQDGMDQSRSLKTGYSLSLSTEFQHQYMLGLEYNIFSEDSGNQSLSIDRSFTELNLVTGYKFIQFNLDVSKKINLWAAGYLGQNKDKIKTELLGSTSTDTSAAEFTYGLGVIAQVKLNFFLLEIGTRILSSKSYEPQTVSVSDLRAGFQFNTNL